MALSKRLERGKDLFCLLLLLAVNAVLCQGILQGRYGLGPEEHFDGDALYGTDTSADRKERPYVDRTPTLIETPRDRWIAARVRSGHLDLWNPYQGAGVPLAPDQGGLFSPLRLLHVLLPDRIGYVLYHCARLWIAAAGTFFLARHQRLTRPAALIAAVGFGFGGGMVGLMPFISVSPLCVLPWVLLAQAALLSKRSALRRSMLGVAIAGTLTAGHPELSAVVLLGAGIQALASLSQSERSPLPVLRDLAMGWALGIAMAAPFLLPFAEYLSHGHHYKDMPRGLSEYGRKLLTTRDWIGADVAGPNTLDAIRDLSTHDYPSSVTFVTGTASWLLAGVALLRKRAPTTMLAIGAFGLLLAFAPWPTPRMLQHVPLIKEILPTYYWPLVMLPVACAAGAGADALAEDRRPVRTFAVAALLFVFVALVALGISTFAGTQYPKPWGRMVADLPAPKPRWMRYHLYVFGAIALVALLAHVAARRVAAALLVVVTVDVVVLMRPFLREKPAVALRRDLPHGAVHVASASFSDHARFSGESPGTSRAAMPMLAGIPDIRMTAPLVPDRYYEFLTAAGFDQATTNACCQYYLPKPRSPWAELAGVRFIAADFRDRIAMATDHSLSIYEKLPLSTIFENPASYSRARLYFGATVVGSREEAAIRLRLMAQGGDHVADTALSEAIVLEPAGKEWPTGLPGQGSTEAVWVKDEPDEVVLQTDGKDPGYLMLADVYYPGWLATVDGAPATIFPADVGFRAVRVEAGSHVVRFVYRPASVRWGLALFALALAAAAASVWLEVRALRRAGASPRAAAPR